MLSKFFVISKIFSFICSPLIWIILIFTLSLIVKSKKIKKKFFISGFICLLFFSNSFIVDEFIRLWEVPAKSYTEYQNKKYTAGIVLGGGMVSKDAKTGRIAFRDNIDRILQAIDLYKKGIIQKIIISSGSGSLIYRNVLESTILKDYLVNILDIPETDILVDSLSDNTHQNAVHTALIINENFKKHGDFLLITSSIHIRRAKACFKQQNIIVDVFATNKLSGNRRWDPIYLFVPNVFALTKWQILFHEIIGYCVYYINGYI